MIESVWWALFALSLISTGVVYRSLVGMGTAAWVRSTDIDELVGSLVATLCWFGWAWGSTALESYHATDTTVETVSASSEAALYIGGALGAILLLTFLKNVVAFVSPNSMPGSNPASDPDLKR